MISKHSIFSCVLLAIIPTIRSATIDVTVGGPGVLKFAPEFVVCFYQPGCLVFNADPCIFQNANLGDVVRFTFQQKNHTATQSTLESPCTPALNGFDSGL